MNVLGRVGSFATRTSAATVGVLRSTRPSTFYKYQLRNLANMVKAQRFVYAKRFVGEPKVTDFKLETEELEPIKDGEVLVKAEFLSVDPYMRPYMAQFPVGVTMIGGQVAEVLESKNPKFPVGSHIFGQFGWRTHTVFNPDDGTHAPIAPYVLPDFGEHPRSLALGLLGMPGNTAWFGLKTICKPKAGEVFVVTGAAGAVGSIVGQMAKAEGCTVIGLAGDDAKCAWIKSLGFDHAINYKTADVNAALKEVAPKGVDIYFDNVGGKLSSIIMHQMNVDGRVAVCGSISSYNTLPSEMEQVPVPQPIIVMKQLTIVGFLVWRWADQWLEGIENVYAMVRDGKIKYQETTTEGFEKTPLAFIDLLRGGNTGKAVVKANL